MDPKLKAFLDLISVSEGTSTHPLTKNNGYDCIVTGVDGPEVMTTYVDHPFAFGRPAKTIRHVPLLTSTAAGRYQILLRYWQAYKAMLGLKDFSPASQDAVAIRQITERHAIPNILSGNIEAAIKECSNIWASLPGAGYGQPEHSMDALLAQYEKLLAEQPVSG